MNVLAILALGVSVAGLIFAALTWYLGLWAIVGVSAAQGVSFVPVMYAGGPSPPEFDVINFKATNRSLLHPVFLRSVGAEGEGTAGERISVDGWLSKPMPIRLEKGQGEPWRMDFDQLAGAGIDLRKGVRGWAKIDASDRNYLSRAVILQQAGNRTIPLPSPKARPR